MLMKHSLTAVIMFVAFSATTTVGLAQEPAGVGVGSGSALLSGDLEGGADFETTPVLNSHVEAAIKHAKTVGREVGFGFYTNATLDLEHVPGEIRYDGSPFYMHQPSWQTEDVDLLVAQFGGEAGDWEFVGDAHVHKKEKRARKKGKKSTGSIDVTSASIQQTQGRQTSSRVLEHSGAPSLNDLMGFMEDEETNLVMVIAGRSKRGKGFDSAILFRQGAQAQKSSEYERITEDAEADSQPRSHGAAVDILRAAYEGGDIAYFAGRFKGKKGELTGGRFKHKGL